MTTSPRLCLPSILLVLSLPASLSAQAYPRRFVNVTWDSISGIEAGDSVIQLVNPLSLVGYGDTVAVVDYGDSKIKCFTKTGKLIGAFGRRGHGPWEVAGLTSVALGADGGIWVGDRGNSRAYSLTHQCSRRAQVFLPQSPHRVFALASGEIVLIAATDSVPRLVDSLSRSTTRSLGAIPPALNADPLVQTALDIVILPRGGFAIAYLYASWLALYSSNGEVVPIAAPDGLSFPPLRRWKVGKDVARVGPDPMARRVSNGIASDGQLLFVLTASVSAGDRDASFQDSDYGDIVDVYSISQRHYLESWRLPRKVRTLSWANDHMIFLSRDPEPAITYWRYARRPQ